MPLNHDLGERKGINLVPRKKNTNIVDGRTPALVEVGSVFCYLHVFYIPGGDICLGHDFCDCFLWERYFLYQIVDENALEVQFDY